MLYLSENVENQRSAYIPKWVLKQLKNCYFCKISIFVFKFHPILLLKKENFAYLGWFGISIIPPMQKFPNFSTIGKNWEGAKNWKNANFVKFAGSVLQIISPKRLQIRCVLETSMYGQIIPLMTFPNHY